MGVEQRRQNPQPEKKFNLLTLGVIGAAFIGVQAATLMIATPTESKDFTEYTRKRGEEVPEEGNV